MGPARHASRHSSRAMITSRVEQNGINNVDDAVRSLDVWLYDIGIVDHNLAIASTHLQH